MYTITYCEQSWIYPIHRILIILCRATLSSRIQIFLLEVHSRRVQIMVVTNGALRPLSSQLGLLSVKSNGCSPSVVAIRDATPEASNFLRGAGNQPEAEDQQSESTPGLQTLAIILSRRFCGHTGRVPSRFMADRAGFRTRPCRSRPCPPCRDAASRVDRFSAGNLFGRCSHSGCRHQWPSCQRAAE
jgi:hypothetical protein